MQKWLRRILKVQSHELKKAILLFSYFFMVIAAYYTLKPVRSSLFLDAFGPEKLPFVYLGTAAITLVVIFLYGALARRVNRETLIGVTLMFFASNLILFWWLFKYHSFLGLSAAFYIWVSNFNLIMVMQFWSLTNDIYNPREGKRLFGFIGSGGILGSITAGFAVAWLVKEIGTENLLLLAAFLLMMLMIIAKAVCSVDKKEKKIQKTKVAEVDKLPESGKNGLKLILESPYLKLIASIVILLNIVATIIDYQFQTIIANQYSKDAMTAFLGTFFSFLTIAAFFIQFFLTSRFHRRFGVIFSLLLMPFIAATGGALFFLVPIFAIGVGLKFMSGSLNYSIQQASKELLYLPTSKEVKYRAKAFIDVFFFRFGDAIASILILVFTALHFSLRGLSSVIVVIALLWLLVIIFIKKRYIASLRDIIKCRGSFCPTNYEEAMAKLAPELKKEDFSDKEEVREKIQEEVRNYFMSLILYHELGTKKDLSIIPIAQQVKEHGFTVAKRLFRLISFVQPAEDLYNSFDYLVLKQRENDAIALELLDNIMLHRIKKKVLPFFDVDNTMEEKFALGCCYWNITADKLQSYLHKIVANMNLPDKEQALQSLDLKVPC